MKENTVYVGPILSMIWNNNKIRIILTKKIMSYTFTLLSWTDVLGFFIDIKVSRSYCAAYQCCVGSCIHSGWKSDLQLWLRRPVRQSSLAAAPSTHIQALFCVSRQVLRLPLWRQRLRGLQGNVLGLWSASQRAHLLHRITSFIKLFPQTTLLSEVIVWLCYALQKEWDFANIWWCCLGEKKGFYFKGKMSLPILLYRAGQRY